jgi:hypothetical protein
MFFLGYCFTEDIHSLDSTPPLNTQINSVTIKNGLFDDLYITRNTTLPDSNTIDDIWDYDTVLHAKFQGDLSAGNVKYSVDNTDSIRIKRRMKGSFDWVSIYEIPIYGIEDFSFEKFDYTARSSTEYEYALVPVSGGSEGSYITNKVGTYFEGLFIMEKGIFFSTIIEVDINNQQRNRPTAAVSTMGKKYPFIISNGLNNYQSGDLSAVFAERIENGCDWDFEQSWRYRERLLDFLYNNAAKLIKYEDGRMYLASVSSNVINEQDAGVDFLVRTSFQWTEVGNCDKGDDLYKFGLIDVKEGVNMSEVNETESRLNIIERQIELLRKNKADDLLFDSQQGTLVLTSESKEVGSRVDLETPFGKEFIIKPI